MNLLIKGRVIWKFGDDFNSDLVTSYPQHKDISDEEGLRRICMTALDPDFPKKVKKGDILVAGKNFGFGHPHVQAHNALKAAGISCIVAESFARLWFRTAISVGFPAYACEGISKSVEVGDTLEVDMEGGTVRNVARDLVLRPSPMYPGILAILKAGGTLPYLRSLDKHVTIPAVGNRATALARQLLASGFGIQGLRSRYVGKAAGLHA